MGLEVRYVEKGLITGSALLKQRDAAGFSQQALADQVNAVIGKEVVYQQMISHWEDPRILEFTVDLDIAQAIQRVLSESAEAKYSTSNS